jgi:hypothetical protein
MTLDEARKAFAKCSGCQTDDAVRTVADIAMQARSKASGWSRLWLLALRALGVYLIQNGRGPGRPPKSPVAGDKQTLACLGIHDDHLSSDAKRVARIPQRVFDAYLAAEEVPTLAGLLRYARPGHNRLADLLARARSVGPADSSIGEADIIPEGWGDDDERHPFTITPPDYYDRLDAELHFDPPDMYPYRRPPGWNALTMGEWPGQRKYCNVPFLAIDDADGHGPTVHVRKAIEQHLKYDKDIMMPLPTRYYELMLLEAGAVPRSAGRVRWLNDKGEATKTPPPIIEWHLRESQHREVPGALHDAGKHTARRAKKPRIPAHDAQRIWLWRGQPCRVSHMRPDGMMTLHFLDGTTQRVNGRRPNDYPPLAKPSAGSTLPTAAERD